MSIKYVLNTRKNKDGGPDILNGDNDINFLFDNGQFYKIDEATGKKLIKEWKDSKAITFTVIWNDIHYGLHGMNIDTRKTTLITNYCESVEQCIKRNKIEDPIFIFEGTPKQL